jgi:hypothetical protein
MRLDWEQGGKMVALELERVKLELEWKLWVVL